jgi:hypothetical protein
MFQGTEDHLLDGITAHTFLATALLKMIQLKTLVITVVCFWLQVNLLTTVLNDSPVLPDETEEDALPILMDSPQSVAFGIFIIWSVSHLVHVFEGRGKITLSNFA